MKHVIDIAGVKYHDNEKNDVSLRVITDHIRSTTFMIGDGVMPSNEGRGYVLRRLLRRAARHGRLLGIKGTFLYKVCETVIRENADAYPNLVEKHDLIVKVIKAEEESFNKTIDTGLTVLENLIATSGSKQLSGADAFKLQDTFGFPIDLTKELLAEKGMTVDVAEYDRLYAESRAAARAARKDAGAEAWKGGSASLKDIPATEFLGYTDYACDGTVKAIELIISPRARRLRSCSTGAYSTARAAARRATPALSRPRAPSLRSPQRARPLTAIYCTSAG